MMRPIINSDRPRVKTFFARGFRVLAALLALVLAAGTLTLSDTGTAQAAPGDRYQLTKGGPVSIDPKGLYASSGGVIYQYENTGTGNATSKLLAERTGAPTDWSGNLGLGKVGGRGALAFYSSSWYTSPSGTKPNVFRLQNGASAIEEFPPLEGSPTGAAWGGASVGPDGKVWFGTNLQSSANTRLNKYDPATGTSMISG